MGGCVWGGGWTDPLPATALLAQAPAPALCHHAYRTACLQGDAVDAPLACVVAGVAADAPMCTAGRLVHERFTQQQAPVHLACILTWMVLLLPPGARRAAGQHRHAPGHGGAGWPHPQRERVPGSTAGRQRSSGAQPAAAPAGSRWAGRQEGQEAQAAACSWMCQIQQLADKHAELATRC